jgi:hypothetical protein
MRAGYGLVKAIKTRYHSTAGLHVALEAHRLSRIVLHVITQRYQLTRKACCNWRRVSRVAWHRSLRWTGRAPAESYQKLVYTSHYRHKRLQVVVEWMTLPRRDQLRTLQSLH